jgi:hypothetical protein
MGEACSMHGRDEKYMLSFRWEKKLRAENHLENLHTYGKAILTIYHKEIMFGRNASDSRQRPTRSLVNTESSNSLL